MHLARLIDETLESKKDKLLGANTYLHICGILNRAFKKTSPFKFRFEKFEDYWRGDYSITGLYDTHKDIKYVIFNFPSTCKYFTLLPSSWSDFKFSISQVCQHESIHENQHKKRGDIFEMEEVIEFRQKEQDCEQDREYLCDSDEIDAYAHDIALEILHYYPRKDPYFVLGNLNLHRKLHSYNYYKKTFNNTDWTPIKTRLYKRIYKWLLITMDKDLF